MDHAKPVARNTDYVEGKTPQTPRIPGVSCQKNPVSTFQIVTNNTYFTAILIQKIIKKKFCMLKASSYNNYNGNKRHSGCSIITLITYEKHNYKKIINGRKQLYQLSEPHNHKN